MEMMTRYSWPGNVRELEHAIVQVDAALREILDDAEADVAAEHARLHPALEREPDRRRNLGPERSGREHGREERGQEAGGSHARDRRMVSVIGCDHPVTERSEGVDKGGLRWRWEGDGKRVPRTIAGPLIAVQSSTSVCAIYCRNPRTPERPCASSPRWPSTPSSYWRPRVVRRPPAAAPTPAPAAASTGTRIGGYVQFRATTQAYQGVTFLFQRARLSLDSALPNHVSTKLLVEFQEIGRAHV